MADRVIILDEALDDLIIGRDFYDKQGEGIGDYFTSSLLSDITSLQVYSGIHPLHHGFHRVLSKRFPFAVYYDIEGGISRVVAVLDMRQDPGSLREALEYRKSQQGVGG